MKTFARLLVTGFLLVPLTGVTCAQSQEQQGTTTRTQKEYFFSQDAPGAQSFATTAPGQNTFVYVSSEMSFDGKVVKGAPYSAQTLRTFTQTLSDGNRISRQSTGATYRDGEGRTRREETFGAMGPWSAQNDAPQTIFINDPVAGVNYVLNASEHTAAKMTINNHIEGAIKKEMATAMAKGAGAPPPPPPPGGPVSTMVLKGGGGDFEYLAVHDKSNAKTEDLGTQSFDGVDAQGTRTTITIPAGKIGNDLPIQIVDERWYSPDLQVVVMTRHSDPQTGESVYKLTNISRGDQPASLFTVPSDYTVKDGAFKMQFHTVRRQSSNSGDQQQ